MRISRKHISWKQSGMTIWQIMIILIVVGFFATAAVAMIPAYIDNSTAKSALHSLEEAYSGRDIQELPDKAIRGQMQKYFQINQVTKDIEDALEITRDKEEVLVSINYEVRKHLFANVDVVMAFENEVILGE